MARPGRPTGTPQRELMRNNQSPDHPAAGVRSPRHEFGPGGGRSRLSTERTMEPKYAQSSAAGRPLTATFFIRPQQAHSVFTAFPCRWIRKHVGRTRVPASNARERSSLGWTAGGTR